MAFISISLDISGSTEAKDKIVRISKNDKENIHNLCEEIIGQFFVLEIDFFLSLLRIGFSIDDIFVPKIIGDETWILINLKDFNSSLESNIKLYRVINSALETCRKLPIHIFITERGSTENEELDYEIPEKPIKDSNILPIKIHIDLIHEAVEVMNIRHKIYNKNNSVFREIIKKDLGDSFAELPDDVFVKIIERLVGGTIIDEKLTKYRTDYIGFEIDRFFRSTKYALPLLPSIGQTFFDSIYSDEDFVNNDYDPFFLSIKVPDKLGDRFQLVKKTLYLKDISGCYPIYHVVQNMNIPVDIMNIKRFSKATYEYLMGCGFSNTELGQ